MGYEEAEAMSSHFPSHKEDKSKSYMWGRRERLLKQFNGKCFWCGIDITVAQCTIDHYIPLYRGGKDNLTNMVASCMLCNKAKGCLGPANFRWSEWLYKRRKLVKSLKTGAVR
jgi:5-methylcytosine-specific restriction endonuclease McrA